MIKSVQRGTAMFDHVNLSPLNITISSVNRNKTFVKAYMRSEYSDRTNVAFTAQLTSNTNLRVDRGNTGTTPSHFTWEVIEFK